MHLCPTVCTFSTRQSAESFLGRLHHDPFCLPAGPITLDGDQFSVRFYGAAELHEALERAARQRSGGG